jgi:ribosomal protein S27AE
MSSTVHESLCPRCGQAVPVTITTPQAGDQFAVEQLECPNCGVGLMRNIEGHADLGWRLAEEPSG